ncbi:3-deoxy-manno-octulosonate cytidylyltransferase [uncultured Butyricimonas sp.]|nr:3-deoxy-manno-octulosonate cytidylyltransferase [uncultured Butyricimonas sp.]
MNVRENSLILIPARYASTRFPGKPLVEIAGKPMVQHVYEKATAVSDYVYVATDDARIYDAVTAFGGRAVMTSTEHRSGTDRCYEAYVKVHEALNRNFGVVVNVQGDEPFIIPRQIESLISRFEEPAVQIATLAKPFERNDDVFDPNKVKVVFSVKNTALYFSRNPIPYCRGVERDGWLARTPYYKHVGMYAYRPEILKAITSIPQGVLEQAESLEQLRWLENGYTIAISITDHESVGIDTPEDLEKIK